MINVIIGKTVNEKNQELMTELSQDVMRFYNENIKKIDFKKITFN